MERRKCAVRSMLSARLAKEISFHPMDASVVEYGMLMLVSCGTLVALKSMNSGSVRSPYGLSIMDEMARPGIFLKLDRAC